MKGLILSVKSEWGAHIELSVEQSLIRLGMSTADFGDSSTGGFLWFIMGATVLRYAGLEMQPSSSESDSLTE